MCFLFYTDSISKVNARYRKLRIVKVFPLKTRNNYGYFLFPTPSGVSRGSVGGLKVPWMTTSRSFCCGLMLELLSTLSVSLRSLMQNQKVVVMMLFQYQNYDSPFFSCVRTSLCLCLSTNAEGDDKNEDECHEGCCDDPGNGSSAVLCDTRGERDHAGLVLIDDINGRQ